MAIKFTAPNQVTRSQSKTPNACAVSYDKHTHSNTTWQAGGVVVVQILKLASQIMTRLSHNKFILPASKNVNTTSNEAKSHIHKLFYCNYTPSSCCCLFLLFAKPKPSTTNMATLPKPSCLPQDLCSWSAVTAWLGLVQLSSQLVGGIIKNSSFQSFHPSFLSFSIQKLQIMLLSLSLLLLLDRSFVMKNKQQTNPQKLQQQQREGERLQEQ